MRILIYVEHYRIISAGAVSTQRQAPKRHSKTQPIIPIVWPIMPNVSIRT